MNRTKLVIFDLDGTLFRTETVDIEAFNRALAANGYPSKSSEEILSLIGMTMDDICKSLIHADDFQILERFKEDVIRFEKEAILSSGQLYSGVDDFLERLKDKQYILCICSNGNKEYVMEIIYKFNLSALFDVIWYEKKGITKVEAVRRIKERFQAEQFIMVGDRLCDIEAAQENNGISIGVAYGFGNEEVKQADYIVKDIPDLERRIIQLCDNSNSI